MTKENVTKKCDRCDYITELCICDVPLDDFDFEIVDDSELEDTDNNSVSSEYNDLMKVFNNSIMLIQPYKLGSVWVFDDSTKGLVKEPFVGGMSEIITEAVRDIPDADKGFVLLFSSQPFSGATLSFSWLRKEGTGNVYKWDQGDMQGWLCPALLKYFDKPPKNIHVQVL